MSKAELPSRAGNMHEYVTGQPMACLTDAAQSRLTKLQGAETNKRRAVKSLVLPLPTPPFKYLPNPPPLLLVPPLPGTSERDQQEELDAGAI
jgi:hypothetical protein